MAKKPPTLTVIDSASKPSPLAPPPGLGEAGAKLWHAIHADYVVDDAGGLAMLQQIWGAADRVAQYAVTIARDGPVIRSKAGLKDHPLLRTELAAQSFIPGDSPPAKYAFTAATVAFAVTFVAVIASFFLPEPPREELPH